jgi:hypothetical protein
MRKISCKFFLTFLLILSINILLITNLYSQVTQEWVRTYNGSGNLNDHAKAITVDSIGNVYITGGTQTNSENVNYLTIKYNTAGIQEWVATYNGPGTNSGDDATSVVTDNNGSVYVTGNSERAGLLTSDYCTIKYSSSGNQQWVARYTGNNGTNLSNAISLDLQGNVYVTGTSTNTNGKQEIATVKYNNNGVQQWVNRYTNNPGMNCYAFSLAVDSLGNVFVGGSCMSFDILLIKYNSSGVQQWVTNSYGIIPIINKIKLDRFGNIYLTGRRQNSNLGHATYITIKYNSSGIQQWLSSYQNPNDTTNDNEAKDIDIDNLGNIYVTGYSWNDTNSYTDYATIKYNPNGVQQWVQRYNGTANSYDNAKALILDNASNVYVTGISRDISGVDNFTTIKYNSSGIQQWLKQYPGGSVGIGIDVFKNVYVTGGNNALSSEEANIVTIKYSQLDGITKTSEIVPTQFNLYQNFPNPFNPKTNIEFSIPNNKSIGKSYVYLIVYDALGREISKIVNDYLNAGEYKVQFDGSNLSSGIYYYSLTVDNILIDTKKLILLK